MSLKPAMFLTSALVGVGLLASSFPAQAGGMSQMGNFGGPIRNFGPSKSAAQICAPNTPVQVNRPTGGQSYGGGNHDFGGGGKLNVQTHNNGGDHNYGGGDQIQR